MTSININQKTKTISVTPVIDTVAYTSGDCIGSLMTLQGAGIYNVASGILQSILISDLSNQGANIDIVIFDSNPSSTTFTNNAALDIADADLPKVIGVAQVTSDSAFVDNGVSFLTNTGIAFKTDLTTMTLYACAVARGTPTYASASDLTFRFTFLQDT